GIYYYFTHENGKHNLVLSDDLSAHKPLPDFSSIDYYPPGSSAVRAKDHISSWFISKQVQPGKYELNEFDFKKPRADLISKSDEVKDHQVSDYEIYDYPGEYVKTDDGDNYAQARIEELHSQYEQAQGQSNVRVISTGGLFTLDKYSRTDQNREYLVVSASHNIHGDDYGTSEGNKGEFYSNNFSVIDSQTPFRAGRITPKPIVQGTQTAIVVGPSDEEIYTDEYGRVKVQFHWDRYGSNDENSSCWIRVAQLWAGRKWGGIHIPRIGQEVIVDFMEGDPDRPIITGRVYNADLMPPYDLPANKTQSGIKSRSSKKGTADNFNEIRMEDKKGSEELYIHAEKNHTNITENDRSEDVGHDRSLHVGHDKSETIDNNKKINVDGTHTETIKKDTITTVVEGKRDVVVKVGDQSTTAEKKSINITAKKSVNIKGETENIGLDGKGDIGIKLKGKPNVDIEATATVLVRAPKVDVGDDEVLIKGNKITLQCGGSSIEILPTKITLSSGSGSLVLDAMGATLNGALVKIN
ncbi:UNVERIFIED_CONTAM: hypothetical protein GTU68_059029, partial [Idotea baltica]|nr:hypothetical protein [Idotea baltica]